MEGGGAEGAVDVGGEAGKDWLFDDEEDEDDDFFWRGRQARVREMGRELERNLVVLLVQRHSDGQLQIVLLLHLCVVSWSSRYLGLLGQGTTQIFLRKVATGGPRGPRGPLALGLGVRGRGGGGVRRHCLVADVTDSGGLLYSKLWQWSSFSGALGTYTLSTVSAVVLGRERGHDDIFTAPHTRGREKERNDEEEEGCGLQGTIP